MDFAPATTATSLLHIFATLYVGLDGLLILTLTGTSNYCDVNARIWDKICSASGQMRYITARCCNTYFPSRKKYLFYLYSMLLAAVRNPRKELAGEKKPVSNLMSPKNRTCHDFSPKPAQMGSRIINIINWSSNEICQSDHLQRDLRRC